MLMYLITISDSRCPQYSSLPYPGKNDLISSLASLMLMYLITISVSRCPRYSSLPYPCKLVTDFRQPCCKVPDCNFAGTNGQITGTLTPAPILGPTNAPTPGIPGRPTPAPTLSMYLPAPQACIPFPRDIYLPTPGLQSVKFCKSYCPWYQLYCYHCAEADLNKTW